MGTTRTTPSSSDLPEFLTSPSAGDLVAAHLTQHTDEFEKRAAERGTDLIDAAQVRMLRRAIVQLSAYHREPAAVAS